LARACVVVFVASLGAGCGGGESGASGETRPTEPAVERWRDAEALFRQDPRWRGADDAYSVDLGGDRVAWLFADTLVSTDPQHRRPPFPTARNTIGLMTGSDPTTARMSFHWRTKRDGRSASFFPEEGDTWFWPGDGERLGRHGPLLVFLMRIRRDPAGPPGWDFKGAGWQAVRIPNPDDPPQEWKLERVASPPNPWNIVVGSGSVLARDGWLYAFGSREPPPHDVHLVRWRLAAAAAGNLGSPQWWAGAERRFVPQASLTTPPTPLFEDGQTEFTVHEVATGGFAAVQTIGFGAATIGVRTAPTLFGPWFPVAFLWRPPESKRPGALIYAAKAHPELDADGALAVTYISSNLDPATAIADEALYYPRFVRVRLPR
jgi:hypothetical protein